MAYKIEKGVQLPAERWEKIKYPFRDLDVGDSFFVPNKAPADLAGSKNWARIKHPERRFITRTVDGGCRVWRVA